MNGQVYGYKHLQHNRIMVKQRNWKSVFLVGAMVLVQTTIYAQSSTSHANPQQVKDLTFLSHDSLEGRSMGTRGEEIAARYIAQRFEGIGLQKKGSADTSYFQFFSKKTKLHPHDYQYQGPELSGRNVIGYLDHAAPTTIVIGAHYDHLGWGDEGSLHTGDSMVHNGADDNASGVASLLFLAEHLSEQQLNSNVLFIAFTGEEKGLLGSNYFMHNPTIETDKINFMINMDMVGRLDSLRRLAVYGVGTSSSFIPEIEAIESPAFQFKMDSSGMGPSDHTSFYVENIPVLHFFTGQHAQYHRPEDDVELINFEGLYDVSLFIERLIVNLDQHEKLVFTKTRDKEQKGRKFNVSLGVIPDYLYQGEGMKIDGVSEGRPAALGGIVKGDVIIKMGDIEIKGMSDYMNALNVFKKGESIQVLVKRGEGKISIPIQFD